MARKFMLLSTLTFLLPLGFLSFFLIEITAERWTASCFK